MLRAPSGSLGPLRNINSFSWCLETGQRCSSFVSNRDLWTTRSRCKPKYLNCKCKPAVGDVVGDTVGHKMNHKRSCLSKRKTLREKIWWVPTGIYSTLAWQNKTAQETTNYTWKKKNKAETNLLWLFNTTLYSKDKVYIHNLHLSLASSEPSASHISAALGN